MKLHINQKGAIGHIEIFIIVLVVAVGGFAVWRVIDANNSNQASIDTTEEVSQLEALPTDLGGLKTIEEIEEISGANVEGVTIVGFVLESENNGYVYKVTLSNGQKLVIDASSGAVLSEETTDVSKDDKIPDGVTVNVGPGEAYALAMKQANGEVVKIEMEVEDNKVTYKIEFKDGSKVEIDASTGAIVKMEIKDEEHSTTENRESEEVDNTDNSNGSQEQEQEQEQENESEQEHNNESENELENESHN